MAQKGARYEVTVSTFRHRWRWRLVAGNGETICTSEPYATEAMARKGIRSVVTNANAKIVDG